MKSYSLFKQPIDKITDVIQKVLTSNSQKLKSIQIELKFAKLVHFDKNFKNKQDHQHYLQNHDQQTKLIIKKLNDQLRQSSKRHLQTLYLCSQQNLIILNDLGKNMCKIHSDYNQSQYFSFYQIRQKLLSLCEEKTNIINHNSNFKLSKKNQIRFDLIIDDKLSQFKGRYSYELEEGSYWTKVKKISLQENNSQIDMIKSRKFLRLAIKNEIQQKVSQQLMNKIKQYIKKQNPSSKNVKVRIKKTIRVIKDNMIQFSMSEVFKPKINEQFVNLLSSCLINQQEQFAKFTINNLTKFYELNNEDSQSKWQLQAEFTKNGLDYLYKLSKQNTQMLKQQLENVIYDFYEICSFEKSDKDKQMELFGLNFKQLSLHQNEIIQGKQKMQKIKFSLRKLLDMNNQ